MGYACGTFTLKENRLKTNKQKHKLGKKHLVALFTVYFTLFLTLSAMVDYYAYDLINPWLFIVLSIAAAVWATAVHARSRQKSQADVLAQELEEIL